MTNDKGLRSTGGRSPAREGITMDERTQKMRLIVNGAISFFENEGLELPGLLKEQNRTDLFLVLDAIMTALYWLQRELTTIQ